MSQYDWTVDLKINVGHCDLYFMVQWFCLIFWRLFDVWTSYFGIMSQYDTIFDLKINVGHGDLCFMVQWFLPYILKTIWYMNTIHWDYESERPYVWPQNFCSTLWPIFHGLVTLPNILKNICRSRWPLFHGPLNLPFILKTVWCTNIILLDYESVWHNIWPRNKCRSLWPIFLGPVILPYILNSRWWMNVILLENESV